MSSQVVAGVTVGGRGVRGVMNDGEGALHVRGVLGSVGVHSRNHVHGRECHGGGWSWAWMWAVGEIGTGLGNVLGNRVICLFWYPSRDASLKVSHQYPSGTLYLLRHRIGILLGHSVR